MALQLRRALPTFWLLFLPAVIFCQSENDAHRQSIIEQRIENIAAAAGEESDIDFNALLEDFEYYFEHPLNLNDAPVEDLRSLYILSDVQILALSDHIEKFGPLRSVFELQAIEHWNIGVIRELLPFITVNTPGMWDELTWKSLITEGKNDLMIRYKRVLEEQSGYLPDPETNEDPAYAGSPDYLYTRYRFQYRRNIYAGLIAEKDAGESMNNGPDFISGTFFLRDRNWLRSVAIGDYQAQFGQGLTFWNGLGFGKSNFTVGTKKNAPGLRPYSSVNEFQFLRGAGVVLGLKKWQLTIFYSKKKRDASLVTDTLISDDGFVSSLSESGYHRTTGEIENQHTLKETVAGGNLKYAGKTGSIGLTAAVIDYSKKIVMTDELRNIDKFSGDHSRNVGLDYDKVFRNINFFGEAAISENGGWAVLNGLVASLHPLLSASVVHRKFERNYFTPYFNVFAENSEPSNESGVYVGIQATPLKNITIVAYADQAKFPWLKFGADAPSNMSDYLVQLNYRPDKKHEFYFRYRVRNRLVNSGGEETPVDFLSSERSENYRLHFSYSPHPNLRFRTRLEWKINRPFQDQKERGFLVYQDIIWDKIGFPLSLNMRYALFDVTSFDAALYAYESTVLYDYSIPAHNGKGIRSYVLVKWDITRKIDFWLRYGTWMYVDKKTVGSGNSTSNGNTRSDLHAQLRYQF